MATREPKQAPKQDERPLAADDESGWSNEIGGGTGRPPFFPLKAITTGSLLRCVCHEIHEPHDADSTYVRDSNGWEGICTIQGRETTLAVASKELASWLRANVHEGTKFELLAGGSDVEFGRRWRARVIP